MTESFLTPLPLSEWRETKITLHLFLQIVGKIRLALTPKRNHWWHVVFYMTADGLTTSPIPYKNGLFEINFNFIQHKVIVKTSDAKKATINLINLSVADFYRQIFEILNEQGIYVKILKKPFDPDRVGSHHNFPSDQTHIYKHSDSVTHYFKMLCKIYPIFMEFQGGFTGKATPIHIFWHSFDLAYTRFSGRKGPSTEGMDPVSAEAYSDEVISFGFWAGDDNLPEPAFYSYTYPDPAGLQNEPLRPNSAFWTEANGSSMAILKYSDLLKESDFYKSILNFLNSAYAAGCSCAKWNLTKEHQS